MAQIQADVESVGVGGLQRLLGGAMQRRRAAVAGAPNREKYYDDFIKNKVFYAVGQRLQVDPADLGLSEQELRRLSLVGGLMAKIAHLDRQVTDDEFANMVAIFQDIWGVTREAATFVVEVAISAVDVTYDTFRMMRELATAASVEERRHVIELLFAISAADGAMSLDEIEEIRVIARGLNLTHKDFIDAKLKVIS
ncbi:MAG: TerB family tellurite resistance protein [Candidatus Promineifilaceae bacterium]